MTDRDNGMSAVQIEIFISRRVPDPATFTFDYLNIEEGIYVK
jgi:hypothetical protein